MPWSSCLLFPLLVFPFTRERRDELENNPIYDDAFGRVLKKQMETAFSIPCADSPMFMVAITFCAKAAREILLGDMNIVSTLNACAELLKELYKR